MWSTDPCSAGDEGHLSAAAVLRVIEMDSVQGMIRFPLHQYQRTWQQPMGRRASLADVEPRSTRPC